MNNDEKLNLIGFKSFVPLKKEERDNLERKLFSSIYNDIWITIKIVKENDSWTIEKIDDEGIINKSLSKQNKITSIDDMILFFKMFYYKNEEIGNYL